MKFEDHVNQIMSKASSIDTWNWEKQRDVVNHNLRRQIELCAQGHPYYRKLFKRHGISPRDIQTVNNLEILPLTTKQAYMEQPDEFRLKLNDRSPYERILYDITYTTGTTTGIPSPFYNTTHDILGLMEQFIRTYRFYNITPTKDVIINLFPFSAIQHIGFRNSSMMGWPSCVPVINPLPGSPYEPFPINNSLDWCVEVIEHFNGTILRGISSFVRRVVTRAQELNKNFSSVRLVYAIGELTPQFMKEDLRQRLQTLGAYNVQIVTNYGFTELQYSMCECGGENNYHNIMPDFAFFEIVDPRTGKRLPDGDEGHLAITHVNRRGTVLLRYLNGDICVMRHDACPHCGREGQQIIKAPYRTSDLIKLKGTLINPKILLDELSKVREIDLFQVVFSKEDLKDLFSQDKLIIRVALRPEVSDKANVEKMVIEHTKVALELTPIVEFVDRNSIYDPKKSLKSSFIVDERPSVRE